MDLGTLVGLVVAMVIMLAAILYGGSILLFIDIPSIMIVFGGTLGVTFVKFKLSTIMKSFQIAIGAAFVENSESPRELVVLAEDLGRKVQKDGVLALEGVEVKNKFFSKGVQLMVDGHSPDFVRSVLTNEMRVAVEEASISERMLRGIADAAPGMGMIGTLIGLVQMLANMADPSTIGPAMAVALITTLYGAMIAQVFCIPMADKISSRNKEQKEMMSMIIEGVISIQLGQSPRVMIELLETYLRDKTEAVKK